MKKGKNVESAPVESVKMVIAPPNIQTVAFKIKGTAPYVQLRFSEKQKNMLLEKWMGESTGARKGKGIREKKDPDAEFQRAMYVSEKGWNGIPATAFRNAIISACRTVGFKMTLAKLSIFVMADGFDKSDGTPLIKVDGKPSQCMHAVRNANMQPDLRIRAMWKEWSATIKIQYDADQFSAKDVANLLSRVGCQVGIGEGRPDGKVSGGMGWGLFRME